MVNEKYTTILSIPSFDDASIQEAKKIFQAYKTERIILNESFESPIWYLSNEYANFTFNFIIEEENFRDYHTYLKMTAARFSEHLKTFILFLLGNLSLNSLQITIHQIKKIVRLPVSELSNLPDYVNAEQIGRIYDFFSLLPIDGIEKELDYITDIIETVQERIFAKNTNFQRNLASFDSYFLFGELLERFWKEEMEESTRLFYAPVYFWWKITGVLPLRPREFVLTPRNCLKESGDKYFITLRKNRIKGSGKNISYKISKDYELVTYQIPKDLFNTISWYITMTETHMENDLKTLFIAEPHYLHWNMRRPYRSRYFTYVNLSTCLRYFYEEIIHTRYGYEITFERNQTYLKSNQIQYLHLGDTRHLAMINLIAEGSTPMVAMLLAGHDNPSMSAHYYANITHLIECKTYRQYKKQLEGTQRYELSKPVKPLNVVNFTMLEDGRCYSPLFAKGDFSDCCSVLGAAGEIGLCQNCTFYRSEDKAFHNSKDLYRSQIEKECEMLVAVIGNIRKNKGEPEDLIQALLRLQSKEYSYQQYLMETMEI